MFRSEKPITSPDGTLIIPVSKVSYGFAAGGSDLPTKKENKDCFGGGSGGTGKWEKKEDKCEIYEKQDAYCTKT